MPHRNPVCLECGAKMVHAGWGEETKPAYYYHDGRRLRIPNRVYQKQRLVCPRCGSTASQWRMRKTENNSSNTSEKRIDNPEESVKNG